MLNQLAQSTPRTGFPSGLLKAHQILTTDCGQPADSVQTSIDTNWGFGSRENWYNTGIIEAVAARWSDEEHPLPPLLFKAVVAAESGFRSQVKSPTGAAGLCQLTRGTAQAHGLKLSPRDERLIPEKCLPVGVAVLDEKHRYLKNPPTSQPFGRRVREAYAELGQPTTEQFQKLALAGYNGGASTVTRAMAAAFDRGLDPRDWDTLVGDPNQMRESPLYQAVEHVYGSRRAPSKYREMAEYPGRVLGFYNQGTTGQL